MAKSDLEGRVRKLEGTISAFSAELRLALDYIQRDAGSSLTKSRTVLEKLLIGIYTAEMGHEPRKPMLGEMLADNQFTRKLDRRIVTRMNSIRDMGNLGPHGADVQPSDAARVLDDLCEVLDWYLLRQGAANSGATANGPALGSATVAPPTGNSLPAAHPDAEKRRAEGGRRNRKWLWLGVGAATLLIILAVVLHGWARSAEELRTTAADVSAEVCASRLSLSLSRTRSDPIHPAIVAKATVLVQRGAMEQRALGSIALEQHSDADQIIQQAKSRPGNSVDESFLLLTLEGDNWYQANDTDKAVRSYEQAEALKPEDVEARNNLAAALLRSRKGDTGANARRAIDIATATLKLAAPGSAEWAKTECISGLAWSQHVAGGDPFANEESAIAAYKSALTVFTKGAYPVEWAMIQNYIGLAYRALPPPPNQPYSAAISAHEAALAVFTKEAFPFEWAETQRALGDALASGGSNLDATDLNRAITAFDAAMNVFTKQSYPAVWAELQCELGAAWLKVPGGNAAENFLKALSYCDSALTVFTKQDYPVPWADTQSDLGAAWLEAPGSSPAERYHKALSYYDSALTVFTKQEYPVGFAVARLKRGEAWVHLAYNEKEKAKRSDSFTRAIGDFDAAQAAISEDSEPGLWSTIEDSRGRAQSALHREDGPDRKAIAP